jgi:hypothetical protein
MSLTIEQKIQNDKYSGTISLIENEIVFSSQETELVRFNISEIRIIAEMTSDADPIKNDWHLVFVNNTTEYYIPAYANNMQDFLKELSGKLQFQIIMTLFASIELNSNILYPNELVGHKLLEQKISYSFGRFGIIFKSKFCVLYLIRK